MHFPTDFEQNMFLVRGVSEKKIKKYILRGSISKLVNCLNKKDFNTKENACNALIQMGNSQVILKLLRVLNDQKIDKSKKSWPLKCLSRIALKDSSILPLIIKFAGDKSIRLEDRRTLIEILGQMGDSRAGSVLKKLFIEGINWGKSTSNIDAQNQIKVIDALIRLQDVQSLIEIINTYAFINQSIADYVLAKAIAALGELSPKCIDKPTPFMGIDIIPAPRELMSTLLKLLESERDMYREAAVRSLIGLGEKCRPYLMRNLNKNVLEVRTACAVALYEMGTDPFSRLNEVLIEALGDRDKVFQHEALEALGKYKEARAVPIVLEKMLSSCQEFKEALAYHPGCERIIFGFPFLFLEAERALIKIGEAAVPALIEALKNPDPFIRTRVVYALEDIGHTSAIEPLEKLIAEKDEIAAIAEKVLIRTFSILRLH